MTKGNSVGISGLWIALGGFVVWLLSSVLPLLPVTPSLALLLAGLPFLGRPLFEFERGTKKTRFTWKWYDWVGVLLFLAVVYAIMNGVDPITLLRELGVIVKKA